MAVQNSGFLREITRYRILGEILESIIRQGSPWKVLIVDNVTLRILNSCCRMSDVTAKNISLVESLEKRRQPQPQLDAIYLLSPSADSVGRLVDDMVGKTPQYKKAHVFFTSRPSDHVLRSITRNPGLSNRVATLKEVNLEYIVVDSQAFITDHSYALQDLFKEANYELGSVYAACIADVAMRLATVFASLKELPSIQYKAPRSESVMPKYRENAPKQLATALLEHLQSSMETLPDFPQAPTCDLLIVDRSIDPVAPLIHDWSYGGMAFELLPVEGNKYTYEVQRSPEEKSTAHTALLDDNDPIWVDLRDRFMPEAYTKLGDLVSELRAKALRPGEATTKELSQLLRNMPKFLDLKDKVDLHVEIADFVNKRLGLESLKDIGHLEQGFVFGDKCAHSKDLEELLKRLPGMSTESKMRLLMLYGATHPEKFDAQRWQEVSRLGAADMATVQRLELLGVDMTRRPWHSRSSRSHSYTKKMSKLEKHGLRTFYRKEVDKDKALFRFYPYIQDLVEDMAEGKLSKECFPAARLPLVAATVPGGSGNGETPGSSANGTRASRAGARWAKRSPPQDGSTPSEPISRPAVVASETPVPRGRRLFVFVIGGMAHSEVRAAHWLTSHLQREVVIGSTSLDTSSDFIQKLRDMASE